MAISVVAQLGQPGSAGAQLPPILPPPPGGGGGGGPSPGPSENVLAPPGEAPAYGANPSRTAEANDPQVLGPLRQRWSVNLHAPVNQPLVVAGRVLVNVAEANSSGRYGSKVVALDAASGRAVWEAPTPGTYFSAPIGAGEGIVVSASVDGVIRAFDLADGTPRWTVELPGASDGSPAIVADGLVYLSLGDTSGGGRLYAIRAADGSVAWRTPPDTPGESPAVDGARVFVADACGGAAAFSRTSGAALWGRTAPDGVGCSGGRASVHAGAVYGADGLVYDAVTGEPRTRLASGQPQAFSGGLGFYHRDGFTFAVDLATGEQRWRGPGSIGEEILPPLVVGGIVLTTRPRVAGRNRLLAFEAATGHLLWKTRLPRPAHVGVGGIWPGLAAGAGRVFVAEGTRVTAAAPLLRPAPRGADIATTATDVTIASRIPLFTGVGYELRESLSSLEVVADRFPFGSKDEAATAKLLGDGSAYFTARPARNTRYSVRVPGAKSKPLTVYAYPRYHLDFDAVSPRYAVAKLSVKRTPARRLEGRSTFLYLDRRGGGGTLRRLGSAKLTQTGRKSARSAIRFRRLKRVGRRDLFVACVKGIERRGYGRLDGLARACGDPRFALRLKSAESRPTPRAADRARQRAARPRPAP